MNIFDHAALKGKRHLIVSELDAALLLARTEPAKSLAGIWRAAMGLKWIASQVFAELLKVRK